MESLTRLAVGGMTVVAASVAVICAVALTHSVALSDAAGSTIDAAPVVVPASTADSEGAGAGEESVPATTTDPVAETRGARAAEVVPAPAPEVVPAAPPASTPEVTDSARPTPPPTEDEVVAEAEASRSWDAARKWAERLGWSPARIDAWIDRLEKSRGPLPGGRAPGGRGDARPGGEETTDGGRQGLVGSGSSHGQVGSPGRGLGAVKGSGPSSKDRRAEAGSSHKRPAHAGANADDRSTNAGVGAKKHRSRDSPDRRD
ncbi:hypothetical protein MK786_15875 [Microbacterium sp. CFH 31415]|uniref:hypothetical protein n=1 Tax=Microbacterium sp. CFH 31415 TaxID=2921732 RepID=UPI001F13B751|nr:hypothetical protein [Microbacterium sp. CFH 31415]MCH6232232.1 hypothetical protein [Microbacterium sp. CFH 31415]